MTPAGSNPDAGSYPGGPDNRAFNPNFLASYNAHSTGTGPYTAPVTVWEQTVTSRQPNQPYSFFWRLNTNPVGKVTLRLMDNGVNV